MIVGEGRAGKTALSNSIIGKPFELTNSTVGINQMTCDVKFASISSCSDAGSEVGGWSEYVKPGKELEAALAQMIRRGGSDDDQGTDDAAKLFAIGAAALGQQFDPEMTYDENYPDNNNGDSYQEARATTSAGGDLSSGSYQKQPLSMVNSLRGRVRGGGGNVMA